MGSSPRAGCEKIAEPNIRAIPRKLRAEITSSPTAEVGIDGFIGVFFVKVDGPSIINYNASVCPSNPSSTASSEGIAFLLIGWGAHYGRFDVILEASDAQEKSSVLGPFRFLIVSHNQSSGDGSNHPGLHFSAS
jgi:hypothetical protein